MDPDDPFSISPTDMHLLVGEITKTIDEDPVLAGTRLKLLSRCGRHFGFALIRDAVKSIVEAWRSLDWFNVILPGAGWRDWNEKYIVSLVISGNASQLEAIRIDRIDLRVLFRPVQNLPALSQEQRDAVKEFLCENERRFAKPKWVPKFDETLFMRRFSANHPHEDKAAISEERQSDAHVDNPRRKSRLWLGPLFDLSAGRSGPRSKPARLDIQHIKSKWGPLFDGKEP